MSPKHLANPLHGILLIVLFSFSAGKRMINPESGAAFYLKELMLSSRFSVGNRSVADETAFLLPYGEETRMHAPPAGERSVKFRS
jgi:hypothetical protein